MLDAQELAFRRPDAGGTHRSRRRRDQPHRRVAIACVATPEPTSRSTTCRSPTSLPMVGIPRFVGPSGGLRIGVRFEHRPRSGADATSANSFSRPTRRRSPSRTGWRNKLSGAPEEPPRVMPSETRSWSSPAASTAQRATGRLGALEAAQVVRPDWQTAPLEPREPPRRSPPAGPTGVAAKSIPARATSKTPLGEPSLRARPAPGGSGVSRLMPGSASA